MYGIKKFFVENSHLNSIEIYDKNLLLYYNKVNMLISLNKKIWPFK